MRTPLTSRDHIISISHVTGSIKLHYQQRISVMSLEEKKIENSTIDRLMDEFTSNLNVDYKVLAKCLSKGLITEDDMSRITAMVRSGRMTEAAMDLVLHVKRSAPGYLKTFCGILNDSKSSFLVPCIEEEYRVQLEAKGKQIPLLRFNEKSTLLPIPRPVQMITGADINADHDREFEFEKLMREQSEQRRLRKQREILERLEMLEQLKLEYLRIMHKRQGVYFPEEEESKKIPVENGRSLKAVPNMLLEVGDVLEDASVKASMEKCKKLHINSDNVHSQFTEFISTVLDTGPYRELTWKKIVMSFSSVAGFGIHLCTNNMSHLAAQVYYDWMPQIIQYRLQPWIDDQGGWVSTILGYLLLCSKCLVGEELFYYFPVSCIGKSHVLGPVGLLTYKCSEHK